MSLEMEKDLKTLVSSVQSLSRVWLFATPRTVACQASLSVTNSWSLPKLMSIESVMPSNHLILCQPLLHHPQSFPTSGSFQMSQFFTSRGQSIGVSASTWVPKNWCFWTVVLEKTPEYSLDSKEIQPVHPKGDQSWVHQKDWCGSWKLW